MDMAKRIERFRVIKVTYADIAYYRGVTVYAVRSAVRRGLLEPSDLGSIARYVLRVPTSRKTKEGAATPGSEAQS
jgi:hypothetical protein